MTVRPDLRGTFGMVASTHWRATQASMGILEAGGNAFDAVVAGAFVLHLVEPHLNGPGGDVPAVFATASDPRPRVLCGQGPLPAAATQETFEAMGLDLVPGAGPLAAVVPGAVDAWLLLLRDHGTMPLAEVLAPAIDVALGGHPLLPAAVATIGLMARTFTEHWPTSAALWLPGGQVPAPWQRHRNRAWAEVLTRLVAEAGSASGREAGIDAARTQWHEGFVADAVIASVASPQRDSSGADHAGLLTAADLAGWQASFEAPAVLRFRGYDIAKTGAWGQGPVLLQALALLGDDLARDLGPPCALGRAEAIHHTVEAMKLAMADREAWYGDRGTTPLERLLSPDYSARRRQLISEVASAELRPGTPDTRVPRLPHPRLSHPPLPHARPSHSPLAPELGEPTVARDGRTRGDTCHIDVVDRRGNIISATPSGGWLQSAPVIAELGFPLGSRAQMSWVEPGLASSLPTAAEVTRDGPRRPRTTLSPTLVLRDGAPVLACGTPGGDQQDQWQLPFLLRHLAGAGVQEAIDAPTWHTTSFPSSFYPREMDPAGLVIEDRIGPAVLAELVARGHRVIEAGAWSLGRLCAVARDPGAGTLSAAATARGSSAHATGR